MRLDRRKLSIFLTLARLFLPLLVTCGLSSASSAQSSCQKLFLSSLEVRKKTLPASAGGPLSYVSIKTPSSEGVYFINKILPQYDVKRRLIIGVDEAHTYLLYKGFRIDSLGIGGVQVISELRKSQLVYGDLAFILYDLPDESLKKLDELITTFKRKSSVSCVSSTCAYVMRAMPDVISEKSFLPTSLIDSLLKYKKSGGKIEVVSLVRTNLEKTLVSLKMDQTNGIVSNYFYASTLASFLSVLSLIGAHFLF